MRKMYLGEELGREGDMLRDGDPTPASVQTLRKGPFSIYMALLNS